MKRTWFVGVTIGVSALGAGAGLMTAGGAGAAQPQAADPARPARPVRPGVKPPSAPDPAALAAASAWVAVFGHSVPPAEIPRMRSFAAVGGTSARAQALTLANSVHFRVMTGLESLELTHIADDGWIDNCYGITRLRSFRMGPASNLTDRSAPFFARNPELRVLVIPGAKLTDAGFARLATLSKLDTLNLTRTQVGDGSLPLIARNPDLRLLFLSFTRVTDAGLPHLYGLRKLERVDLQGQGRTPAGIADLKARLPDTCRVVYP